MKKQSLSGPDRNFFELVAKAAFINPFSDERVELNRKIAGADRKTEDEDLIDDVIRRVTERVRKLEGDAADDLRGYSAEDQAVLRYALLFDVFHRFVDDYDQLIQDDLASDDSPCPVPFARDALALLKRRGFTTAVANGYFAMFYQLRRAYYFVDRSIIGRSAVMKEFRRRLWNNVFTHDIQWYERHLWNRMEDFSTLLLGETGTGKGAAAAAIGQSCFIPFDENKERFARGIGRTFVSMNLSQFPEALIESELFGHRKGAFTGAMDHYDGVLSRCQPHGAIFLDEIGEVPSTVQIKLLQVLQERTFSPVGSHDKKRFHGRVIAATNRSPDELLRDRRMRPDFYYRLCSDVITAPPLRDRLREDPAERDRLVGHIIRRTIGASSPALAGRVSEALDRAPGRAYTWPGNVRELEQAIRRILLTGSYEGMPVPDTGTGGSLESRLVYGVRNGALTAQDLLAHYCALLHQRFGTYGEVARRTGLNWRTVKKHVENQKD